MDGQRLSRDRADRDSPGIGTLRTILGTLESRLATGSIGPRLITERVRHRLSSWSAGSRLKLEGTRDGRVYATVNRRVLAEEERGTFVERGTVPAPREERSDLAGRLRTGRTLKPLVEAITGAFPTANVWPLSDGRLVATVDRWLLASADGGGAWTVTGRLPPSSGPMGVLPSAFCTTEEALYLGEYPLGDDAARVRTSTDGGGTWSTALVLPEVRHVHSVQIDPYTGDLWLTTGDAGDECRIGRLVDGVFERVGGGDQRWRAVELVFTPGAVLWGMDSVYEPTNPIFRLPRGEVGRPDPTPEPCHVLPSSVYYGEGFTVDGVRWAAFSTADEAGGDSTAPGDRGGNRSGGATVVAASSATDFTEWHELASYEKRPVPADRTPLDGRVPSANAYVFLASVEGRGLVVNPFNTAAESGTLQWYPPRFFDELE